MDLGLLELFCVVYEERGFSKAAARLNLTQPTISEHIRTLEEKFGTPLFDRTGRQVRPTGAGELLYKYGRQLSDVRRTILEAMSNYLHSLEGKLRISASTIPGEYLLPRILGRFHKKYPKVEVLVSVSDTERVHRDVEEFSADLGFAGARIHDGDLQFERFASDNLILVVPRSSRWAKLSELSLKEVRAVPLLVREEGSGTRAILERRLKALGYGLSDFNVVAQLGSTASIKEAVGAGVGVSITSSIAVRHELRCGLMRKVRIRELGSLRRDFYIVRNKRRTPSPSSKALLDLFR
jgi:DNA-binding transcriptional LysR family regulator